MFNKLIIDKLSIYSNISEKSSLISNREVNEYLKNYGKKIDISIKHNKLWITLCPYKYLYKTNDNLNGVTFQEFKDIIERINDILLYIEDFYSIKTEDSLYNFSISGIDLTTNISGDYLFKSYISLF